MRWVATRSGSTVVPASVYHEALSRSFGLPADPGFRRKDTNGVKRLDSYR